MIEDIFFLSTQVLIIYIRKYFNEFVRNYYTVMFKNKKKRYILKTLQEPFVLILDWAVLRRRNLGQDRDFQILIAFFAVQLLFWKKI